MSKFIFGEFRSEIVEKRSRFVAIAKNIKSKQDAIELINSNKKTFHDAKHIIYAYILLDSQKKYSDDGEPQGTAGIQILNNLEHNNLFFSIIIVIRYFGGILLGTGGLSRAYFLAAETVLQNAILLESNNFYAINISLSYDIFKQINYELKKHDCLISKITYEQDIKIIFYVQDRFYDSIILSIKKLDPRKIKLLSQEKTFGAIYNNKFVSPK